MRPHRRTSPRRAAASVGAAIVMLAAAACTEETATPSTDACADAIEDASRAIALDDQIAELDRALVVCRSVAALDAQLTTHPGLVGYDTVTFATNRCAISDDPLVQVSTVCNTVGVPTTTTTVAPGDTVVLLAYAGETLDGRQYTIREGTGTPFVDGRPAPIVEIVDIAGEDGCEGVIAERDRYAALANGSPPDDEASVYAQHAENVANLFGCSVPPITTVPEPTPAPPPDAGDPADTGDTTG